MGTLNPNANPTPRLGFKLGLQTYMDTMLGAGTAANAEHGTFYLTQDTHRLYIGNSDGSVSAVNEGVITVARYEDLPVISTAADQRAHAGQFYYITGGSAANVLCVYSNGNWVQINASASIGGFTRTVNVNNNGEATITHTITENNGASQPWVTNFTVKGQDGVTVTGDSGNGIILNGNVGSLSAEAVEVGGVAQTNKVNVKLDNSNGADSTIEIDGGSNTTVSLSNGKIVIDSTDTSNRSVVVGPNANNSNNGFVVTVTDERGVEKSGSVDPIITYGDNNGSSAHFVNGTAALSIYTKTEVDDIVDQQLRSLNAMTYKGTSTGANLPTTNVEIGDTYILTEPYTYQGTTYPAGSMFIANGTEDAATGYITAATLTWDAVDASGTDSQYRFEKMTHGVILKNTTTNAEAGSFSVAAGGGIALTDDTAANYNRVVTIAHGAVTTATDVHTTDHETPNNGTEVVSVLTGVDRDTYGHITNVRYCEVTLKNTQGDLQADSSTATTANNVATVSLSYKLHRTDGSDSVATNSFAITSENLTVGNSGSTVAINLLWGSFGSQS